MNKTMLAVLVATLVAPFALADHTPTAACSSRDFPATGVHELELGGRIFYLEDRGVTTGGTWLYEETNSHYVAGDLSHSLQRGGSSGYVPDTTDKCIDDPRIYPDTLVF